MRRRIAFALAVLALAAPPALAGAGWEPVTSEDGVTIYRRDRSGSGVQEIRAVGTIDAPCGVIERVLEDVGIFPAIIPYMTSSVVLGRQGDVVRSHHTIELPRIAPRDVVVLLEEEQSRGPDGTLELRIRFRALDGAAPPPDRGVVRIEALEGEARLVGREGDGRTDVDLVLFVEPGGMLPAPLVNFATTLAAPMVLDNLEQLAQRAR